MDPYLWLLPTVQCIDAQGDFIITHHDESLVIERLGAVAMDLVYRLDGTRTAGEFEREPIAPILLQLLNTKGWLVTLSRPIGDIIAGRPWISRQLSYYAHLNADCPDRGLAELAGRSALIIGLGGVGSRVAFSLAASGLGALTVCDRDIVEHSNINRQFMYTVAHIGRAKAEIVAGTLRERFPGLSIEGLRIDFDSIRDVESLPAGDIVILCGEITTLYRKPTLVAGRPFVMAGYYGASGVVGPLIWTERGTPCWQCVLTNARGEFAPAYDDEGMQRPHAWNSSGSTVNGVVGEILAEVALRVLAPSLGPPLLLNERWTIDMSSLLIQREPTGLRICCHSADVNGEA